jgi:hypothetical protein
MAAEESSSGKTVLVVGAGSDGLAQALAAQGYQVQWAQAAAVAVEGTWPVGADADAAQAARLEAAHAALVERDHVVALEARAGRAETRVRELEAERMAQWVRRDEVDASWSWRAGRAVTWPARQVFRLLGRRDTL